jgi:hypothetical protein
MEQTYLLTCYINDRSDCHEIQTLFPFFAEFKIMLKTAVFLLEASPKSTHNDSKNELSKMASIFT